MYYSNPFLDPIFSSRDQTDQLTECVLTLVWPWTLVQLLQDGIDPEISISHLTLWELLIMTIKPSFHVFLKIS